MKIFILFYMIKIYFFLNKNTNKFKYLEYSFKRNLTINDLFTPEDFFKIYFYNQIYINITVGSNKSIIPFYFYLQQYPFVIESSNVSESQVKGLYNEMESKTYKSKSDENTFILGDLYKAYLSEDYLYFNSNINSSIKFYLAKENIEYSHITEGGKIGFKPFEIYSEDEKTSFIENLKNNKIISSKIFSFRYDSNKIDEDSGKLYIGDLPHNINPIKFNENDYIGIPAENHYYFTHYDWIYKFREIKVGGNIIEKEREAYFYSELGFIIGNRFFFNYLKNLDIWNEYLYKNKKCHEYEFYINDFESNDYIQRFLSKFTGYYCDKDVDIEKLNLGKISFITIANQYSFDFNIKELWMVKNEYKYFMIIKSEDLEDLWYFGKPFFKKYQMVFEYDKKQIGLYTKMSNNQNENVNKSNIIYILIIVGLVIIIIGLGFLLIKSYINLPRMKRANELNDDEYEYNGIDNKNSENNQIMEDNNKEGEYKSYAIN